MPRAVVVGAGIFGLSCASALVDRKWSVTVIEQEFGGNRASSAGDTRLFRLSHGGDDWHRDSARQARTGWIEWSERSGIELFRETGAVWMADSTNGWVGRSRDELERAGDAVEDLDHERLAALLPGIDPSGIQLAYLEVGAGVLFADRARRALRALLDHAGVHMVQDRVRVSNGSAHGQTGAHGADVTIWACGPWLSKLFPGLVELTVTQQDLVNLTGPLGWHNAPAWLDFSTTWYGTGDVGSGIKVATDAYGPTLDPDADERALMHRSIDDARAFLRTRFPPLADLAVVGSHVCQYARTPDSEFIVARHPEHRNAWVLGGGSGHGFKHGPALGEYLADALEGRKAPLDRHGLGPRRSSGGLRMDAD